MESFLEMTSKITSENTSRITSENTSTIDLARDELSSKHLSSTIEIAESVYSKIDAQIVKLSDVRDQTSSNSTISLRCQQDIPVMLTDSNSLPILAVNNSLSLPTIMHDNELALINPEDCEKIKPCTSLIYVIENDKDRNTDPYPIEKVRIFVSRKEEEQDYISCNATLLNPELLVYISVHCPYNVFKYRDSIYTSEEICKIIPFTEYGTIPEHFFDRAEICQSMSTDRLIVRVVDGRNSTDTLSSTVNSKPVKISKIYQTRYFVENPVLETFITMCENAKVLNRLRRSHLSLAAIK